MSRCLVPAEFARNLIFFCPFTRGRFVRCCRCLRRLVFILGISIVALPGMAAQDQAEHGDWPREAEAGWKRIQDALDPIRLRGVVRETMRFQDEDDYIRDDTYIIEYIRSGESQKLRTIVEGDQYVDAVTVLGEPAFAVDRSSKGAAYKLSNLNALPGSFVARLNEIDDVIGSAGLSVGRSEASAGVHLLPELRELGEFLVTKVEAINTDGESLTRVEFEYRPNNPEDDQRQNYYNMSGWFLVDPNLDNAVRAYEVERHDVVHPEDNSLDLEISGKVRYVEGSACRYLPQEVRYTYVSVRPDGRRFERALWFEGEDYSTDPVPDREFTLAAYGLGDVARPAGGPRGMLGYWAFGIAVAAISLSIVLKRMSR